MSELMFPSNPALTAAQLAVRDGDTASLEAWAQEVEAAGNAEAAGVIRDLPGLRDNIGGHLTEQRRTWPDVGVALHHQNETSYWFLGDCDMAESTDQYPNHWPHTMGLLVQHWNVYYPGIEWLARQLGFQLVKLDGYRPSVRRSIVIRFALHEGARLPPLEAGDTLNTIWLDVYVPPKVAGPGECPNCAGQRNVTCEACGGEAFVVVNGEEQECERCDCLGFHPCPVCKGKGKLKPKPVAKPKKDSPKAKPAADTKTPAKKRPKK
jgi:hypothetical protein